MSLSCGDSLLLWFVHPLHDDIGFLERFVGKIRDVQQLLVVDFLLFSLVSERNQEQMGEKLVLAHRLTEFGNQAFSCSAFTETHESSCDRVNWTGNKELLDSTVA